MVSLPPTKLEITSREKSLSTFSTEQCFWFGVAIQHLWPVYADVWSEFLHGKIAEALEWSRPDFIKELDLVEFSLGKDPPIPELVKVMIYFFVGLSL